MGGAGCCARRASGGAARMQNVAARADSPGCGLRNGHCRCARRDCVRFPEDFSSFLSNHPTFSRKIRPYRMIEQDFPATGQGISTVGQGVPTIGKGCRTTGKLCPTTGQPRPLARQGCPSIGPACPVAGQRCPTAQPSCSTIGQDCSTARPPLPTTGQPYRIARRPRCISRRDRSDTKPNRRAQRAAKALLSRRLQDTTHS